MGYAERFTQDHPKIVTNNRDYQGTQNKRITSPPKEFITTKNLNPYISRPNVPTLGTYALPATVGMMALQPSIDYIKQMYDDKFRELQLGRYAPASTNEAPTSTIETPYVPKVGVLPLKPLELPNATPLPDTLISVLKGSQENIEGVARSILYSNDLVTKSINDLSKIISLNSEIDIAYREIELQNTLDSNSYLMNISNVLTKQLVDYNAENELVQVYRDETFTIVSDTLTELKALTTSIKLIPETLKQGVQIQKSVNEDALIAKKLQHINYDTTPIQLDNIGDVIPKVTPQEMRAIKDAVIAKKNSDENTFELNDEDLDNIFGMPDISSIFDYASKSQRITELSQGTV